MKELRNEKMKNKRAESKKLKVRKLKVESEKLKVKRNKKQKLMILIAERLSDINAVQPFSPRRMFGCPAYKLF